MAHILTDVKVGPNRAETAFQRWRLYWWKCGWGGAKLGLDLCKMASILTEVLSGAGPSWSGASCQRWRLY